MVDSSDPSKGMQVDERDWYPIPGVLYLPVGPTVIHESHFAKKAT